MRVVGEAFVWGLLAATTLTLGALTTRWRSMAAPPPSFSMCASGSSSMKRLGMEAVQLA